MCGLWCDCLLSSVELKNTPRLEHFLNLYCTWHPKQYFLLSCWIICWRKGLISSWHNLLYVVNICRVPRKCLSYNEWSKKSYYYNKVSEDNDKLKGKTEILQLTSSLSNIKKKPSLNMLCDLKNLLNINARLFFRNKQSPNLSNFTQQEFIFCFTCVVRVLCSTR